jgi:glycosyltransferase involved in cell wall biosynthesis
MRALSAVVITHNEEKYIAQCIRALQQVIDDIVVVDSFSTDRTPQICQALGVRFYQKAWSGYSNQKNFGNALALHDWVLSVDADEYLSEELVRDIRRMMLSPTNGAQAYRIRFCSFLGNKRIRFGGWNPEHHVRLFDRRQISWNTDAVHEGLTMPANACVDTLRGVVYHFTAESAAQFTLKTDRYSTLFAKKNLRPQKKVNFVKLYISPAFRFVKEYVFKLGFLDGYEGWFIAKENARYTYLKYHKQMNPRTIAEPSYQEVAISS